jgi:hypothetical protein
MIYPHTKSHMRSSSGSKKKAREDFRTATILLFYIPPKATRQKQHIFG